MHLLETSSSLLFFLTGFQPPMRTFSCLVGVELASYFKSCDLLSMVEHVELCLKEKLRKERLIQIEEGVASENGGGEELADLLVLEKTGPPGKKKVG